SISRLAPASSGAAGRAGRGRRNVVRARTTALEGPASRWPITVLTLAMPTATRPVIRNLRRPGCGWDAARGGGPDGTHEVPGAGGPPAAGTSPTSTAGTSPTSAAGAVEPVSCPAGPG